ncbi:Trafficking protein particle complex subunit 33 [Ascosphaera pollenicola]|nr:Trafficking protein particle complex subunit 33 [Ascosphaera pollenicola]
MNYLLPLEWTTTFIPLQDRCPVSSYEAIEAMFEQDTGRKIEDVFSTFAREPVGAASLAQVHIGVLKETGQKVAVKLQHPALDEWVPLDCALTRTTFAVLKKVFPEYDLEWLSREMDLSLPQELDFAREGRNAQRTAKYFKENTDAPLVIPRVISSQRRILIMDYVAGSRIDDLEYLDRNGIDRDEVSAALARIFNEMIFGHGAYLHCDPHGGNIAIRKNEKRKGANFDIILYDHGLYREMPLDLQRSYAKLWLAVLDGDEPRMRRYAYEAAGVKDGDFRLFASAITGRDYLTATRGVVSPRTSDEKEKIAAKFSDGLLQDLVILLGKMPRIILLILKTNDLTRCLDENLHTRHGPLRTFLILARYATITVFDEQMQQIREAGSLLQPRNLARFVQAWWRYLRVELKLELYEKYLSLRGRLGVTKAL